MLYKESYIQEMNQACYRLSVSKTTFFFGIQYSTNFIPYDEILWQKKYFASNWSLVIKTEHSAVAKYEDFSQSNNLITRTKSWEEGFVQELFDYIPPQQQKLWHDSHIDALESNMACKQKTVGSLKLKLTECIKCPPSINHLISGLLLKIHIGNGRSSKTTWKIFLPKQMSKCCIYFFWVWKHLKVCCL